MCKYYIEIWSTNRHVHSVRILVFFKPVVVQYHFMLNLLTLVFFPHLLWMSRLEIRWLKVKSLKNYYICVCYFIVYDLKAFVYSPEYPFLLSFKSSILNLFNDEVSLLIFDIFYMYILKQVRFCRYYLKRKEWNLLEYLLENWTLLLAHLSWKRDNKFLHRNI